MTNYIDATNTTGIIVKAIAGFYYVDTGEVVMECKARGKFRNNSQTPLVGDRVEITLTENGKATVDKILPRKNAFVRPPIANLDRLFIIASVNEPAPNTFVIDKLTSYSGKNGAEPIIVVNKPDLGQPESLIGIYQKAGYKTVCVSGITGDGIDEIKQLLIGKISAFTGNSGVGKSSILNLIMPELTLETAQTSRKLGRGRHTTRHTELFKCDGGYIADTPGFSSFELNDELFIRKDELADCFPDIKPYTDNCRFTSCSHTGEKGCGVINALNDGKIGQTRFDSYVRMYKDAAKIPDWQLNKNRKGE